MSTERQQPVRIHDHELSWMFTDAVGLYHLGRKYTSLLLLLCAVDALARAADPANDNVGERFQGFLRDRLPKHTHVENFNIRVPQRDEMFRLEYILYKYLRNPVVHEGAHLDVTAPAKFAVYIDWAWGAPSVHVDNDNNRVVLGGDWTLDILGGVVQDALVEESSKRPS
jgi:hypothetical protein